ncbi:hypothetical protein NYE33_11100 [Paenibacillus sp. FSL R10-2199]
MLREFGEKYTLKGISKMLNQLVLATLHESHLYSGTSQ